MNALLRDAVRMMPRAMGILVVACVWGCGRQEEKPELPTSAETVAKAPADRPAPVFQKTYSLASAEYTGAESCRECHEKRVEEFAPTLHARAARLPGPDSFAGEFEPGRNVYQTRDPNLRFEMTTDGTNWFQTRIQKTVDGEKRERKKVGLVYGTAALDEICLFWEGNRIHEMPIAYAGPLKRWINAPGYVDGQADFSGGAETCINCHNTHVRHVAGSPGEFHRDGLMVGVSCEKCHGPGSEHIAYHRDQPGGKRGKYIADPGSMTRQQQNDLCSECHSDVGQPKRPLFSYRPGERLEDYYHVSKLQKSAEHQHTANHIRYLEKSKCFQESATLSCVSCHDPHVPEGAGNSQSATRSCHGCHQQEDCGERAELPVPVRDRCVDCHMPLGPDLHMGFHGPEGMLFPGINRREHNIGVYPLTTKQLLARHYRNESGPEAKGLAASLSKEIAGELLEKGIEAEGKLEFAMAMTALREAKEFAVDPGQIDEVWDRIAEKREGFQIAFFEGASAVARDDPEKGAKRLKDALEIKPDFALAHFHLGEAYQALGDQTEAMHQFREALEADPELPAAHARLGMALHIAGDIDQAIERYERALELKPRSPETWNNLGMARASKEDGERAIGHYRKALELDSGSVSARNNLGALLERMGRGEEAIEILREAVELAPDSSEARFNLGGALRRAGDLEGAVMHYRAAVDANNHPGARNNLAMLLMMVGQREEATLHFEAILKQRPDSVPHIVFLAKMLALPDDPAKQDAARSLTLALRATELTGRGDPNALAALALAQGANGDFAAAAATAETAAGIAERAGVRDLGADLRAKAAVYSRREMPSVEAVFPAR